MKTLLQILFLLLFLAVISYSQSYTLPQIEYYKVSKVKIFINDRSDIKKLRGQGIKIEQVKVSQNYFETYMDSVQIDNLKKSGYPYEIIIDDVTKDYLERTKESREQIKLKKPSQAVGFGYGSMGGFYTYSEVIAELDAMRSQYPNLITEKDSIGSSIEGRTIWAAKISDNPDVNEDEPKVFYNALIHAREPEGMMAVIYFMYYLLENYGTNPEVTYLIDNREFYFVPVINPDGYVYNQQISPDGGGMWRKNKRDNDSNGIFQTAYDGVDLNRNYGYMWGYDDIGSSPNTSYEDYRGTGAFSEPEIQAIREYCKSHHFLTSNNFHSFWNVIAPPWGYNSTQTSDSIIFNTIIKLATQLNGYDSWWDIPDSYPTNGDVTDWMYGETTEKNRIYGLLTEVGGDDDGFWPIPERIFTIAEENCYLNKVIAWGPQVIENPPYISEAGINRYYCKPLIDTIKISATDFNPDNHSSNVYAKVLNSKDSLVNELQLNKIDSFYGGSLTINSDNEDFYRIVLEQDGLDIPSKLFYNKLKFTTAGPLIVDSIVVGAPAQRRCSFRPYLNNIGNKLPINNVSMKIICNDSWITSFTGNNVTFPTIQPGSQVLSNNTSIIYYDSTSPGYFNLKFEIASNGWMYWTVFLKFVDPNWVGVEEEKSLPTVYSLSQNFPNPFNPNTNIKYSIPELSKVKFVLYNLLGEEVITLIDEEKNAGNYEIEFNAENIPSGVYFYQLKAGDFIQTKKMILLK